MNHVARCNGGAKLIPDSIEIIGGHRPRERNGIVIKRSAKSAITLRLASFLQLSKARTCQRNQRPSVSPIALPEAWLSHDPPDPF